MAQDLKNLVVKAQKGDKKALNDLIAQCYDDLYYFAYKTVKDEALAADITQESCVTILQKLNTLKDPGAFKSWARQIVYHQCSHHFRDAKEVQATENEDGETVFDTLADTDTSVMPEAVTEDKAFQKIMQDLLDELPAEQRSALMLYYYEKVSVGEIASIQSVSEGTIKSRLNYGRKAVKTKVEEYEKKNDVRLHSSAILPALLSFLFQLGKEETAKAGMALAPGVAAGVGTATVGIGVKIAVATGLVLSFGAIGGVIGSHIINPGPPPTNPTIIATPTSSSTTAPATSSATAGTTVPTTPIPTTAQTTTANSTTTSSSTTAATAKPSTSTSTSTISTTSSPIIITPPNVNIYGITDFLYIKGFVPGMTQKDLSSLAESLIYEGQNIKEAAPGYYYDSQYGGGYRSQGSQFGFSNDYTRSPDRTRATSTNSLYTYVPLEGLDLPYGITFTSDLSGVLQKIGFGTEPYNNFVSDADAPGVMTLYYDGAARLTLTDFAKKPDTPENNKFTFNLKFTETYETTLTDDRIANVTRTFSMSFSGSEDTLGFVSMSVEMKYPLNQE